jgi:hypothetical protein
MVFLQYGKTGLKRNWMRNYQIYNTLWQFDQVLLIAGNPFSWIKIRDFIN